MKKILFNLMIVLSAFAAFSSCKEDEDRDLAMTLSGEWEGKFGAYYTISIKGSTPETYSTRTTYLKFDPQYEFAKNGSGVEIDYYDDGPYEYLSYDFKWKVKDGIITLMFLDYEDMDIEINDYDMDSSDFWGHLKGKKFHLTKLSSHYDWDTRKSFSMREEVEVEKPEPEHKLQD